MIDDIRRPQHTRLGLAPPLVYVADLPPGRTARLLFSRVAAASLGRSIEPYNGICTPNISRHHVSETMELGIHNPPV